MPRPVTPAGTHPDPLVNAIERIRATRAMPASSLSKAMARPDNAWAQIMRMNISPKICDLRLAAHSLGLSIELRDSAGRKVG